MIRRLADGGLDAAKEELIELVRAHIRALRSPAPCAPVTLAVVGSRQLNGAEDCRMVGDVLLGVCGGGDVATIVSGGAEGPDTHAARFVWLAPHEQALTLTEHRPDFPEAGSRSKDFVRAYREAAMARNALIVDACHALLFFQMLDRDCRHAGRRGQGGKAVQGRLWTLRLSQRHGQRRRILRVQQFELVTTRSARSCTFFYRTPHPPRASHQHNLLQSPRRAHASTVARGIAFERACAAAW